MPVGLHEMTLISKLIGSFSENTCVVGWLVASHKRARDLSVGHRRDTED